VYNKFFEHISDTGIMTHIVLVLITQNCIN